MKTGNINGKRCVVLKRCSSAAQVGTSISNQGKTIEQCIKDHSLQVVEVLELEGVTGSVPFLREDIERVIRRKRTKNDFELIVCQDATRFTRAGQGHGQKLIYDLRSAGIEVYFVAEDVLVNDDMAEMWVGFLFNAARESVKRIAYGATSGTTNSFLDNRSPHCRRPPYGLDRMYSDGGVDRHIIRNLPDGTQEQRDPQTDDLIRRFGKNDGKGIPNHYIKQKNEQIRLVPGDPMNVATDRMIFYKHDVLGMSAREIARDLNDAGIPSPSGGEWWAVTVQSILNNPIYVGLGIRNRNATGIYYYGSDGQPIPSEADVEELANRRRPKNRKRPRGEWLEKPQPHLKDFLPPEVYKLAKARIEAKLEAEANPQPVKWNRDRHVNSPYLLKGFIFSKQGEHPMTGRQGGKKGHAIRYYAVARGEGVPKSNNVLTRRVQAKPLERAVMDIVRELLLSRPMLIEALRKLLQNEQKDQARYEGAEGIEQAQRQLKRRKKQVMALVEGISYDDEEDKAALAKIDAYKQEIRALQQRIENESEKREDRPADPMLNVQRLADELHDFGENLDPEDVPAVRSLLEIIIERIEVDLETKEVEMSFHLPSWMSGALANGDGLGLEKLSAYKPVFKAQPENGVVLATFHCTLEGKRTDRCFKCSRTAA